MNTIQKIMWMERAGLLTEKKEHLTDAEIDKILKHLRMQDEQELKEMSLKESHFDEEDDLYELAEETENKKASPDTKGKLHEILTGYHLLGGKHMEKHPDKNGDSPEEAHDRLKKLVSNNEYKKINNRAKSAANDIKKKVEVDGHKIHQVHWTSQPNDLLRTTGIKATQKEDSSDIVASTRKKKQVKHNGISLKVTDSSSKHVPTSNLGIGSAGPKAQDIHDEHRKDIIKKYPKLVTQATNADQRKKMLKDNPKMNAYVKKKNAETLNKISSHLHEHLSNLPKEELVDHIRKVIHAHKTPMQNEGHNHIRHTSYTSRGEFKHHSIDPSEHHEHIFNDHENIEVHHSGTGVQFKYKGKTFASHRIKFNSQSDPLSSIKGSGTTAGD